MGGYYFSDGLLDAICALNVAESTSVVNEPKPRDTAQLILTQESGAGTFMERAAEEAVVDSQLVTSVVDWIAALEGAPSQVAPVPDVAANATTARQASTAMTLDDGAIVYEQFVTLGPDQLVGVLTSPTPATDIPDEVYMLVNSGSDPHTGPGRAWVELARYLAVRGRSTIRVDLRSWGESPDGPSVPGRPGDAHAVEDVIRVVAALNDGRRRRVVLGGLCAGAWTSMEAARHVDVTGLVMLNPQLYWQPGDPTEPLIEDTRARRMPEIQQIREDARRGRWDEEDRHGLRPPAGAWLDDLVRLGRKTSMLFAEGDDGLEYLQDRLARRIRDVIDSGVIRVVEMKSVDHAMSRSWQRSIVFDAIAAELDWIHGAVDSHPERHPEGALGHKR
jgi:pimeloyl-ACP methyl ester carboxylesterase